MRIIVLCLSLLMTGMLGGCLSYDLSRKIVQQGNLLPENKIQQLRPGMSKEQVASLMGTSLTSPTFNNDRWDYAYTWRKGSGTMKVRTVVIYFSHGVITNITHKP